MKVLCIRRDLKGFMVLSSTVVDIPFNVSLLQLSIIHSNSSD